MKVVIIIATLLSSLHLVSGQTCADDCRIVCGNDLTSSVLTGPSATVKRGKHGPKGQKGEMGLPGETGLSGRDGVDNSGLVSKMEKKHDSLEYLVYKVIQKLAHKGLNEEIAKGKSLVVEVSCYK